MGHITHQYGPYYKPSPAPPRGRGLKGFLIRLIRLISPISPISPIRLISTKKHTSPLGGD